MKDQTNFSKAERIAFAQGRRDYMRFSDNVNPYHPDSLSFQAYNDGRFEQWILCKQAHASMTEEG